METVQDDELAKVRNIWEQVCGEWSDFERDVRDEIKYLEQTVLESNSVISKGSKRSKTTKSVKSKSSSDSVLSTKVDKYKLLQEEPALKEKLVSLCGTRKGRRNRKVKTGAETGRIQS